MATLASDELRFIADQVVHHCGYPSAVLSGILPDRSHLSSGGFHCSIEDLLAYDNGSDYSNTRADDKGFNPQYGAALDVSMNPSDMVRAHDRIRTVWADKADPRRKYVNAINCWDGSGDATRYDFDAGVAKYASPDHRWHNHVEVHRRFVRDAKAARAVVSIFRGEPKPMWIGREEPAAAKPPTGVIMLPIEGVLPELKRGMKDPINGWSMVSRLQKLLGITADGDYGPATAAAVRSYNATALKRTVDGHTVDAATWKRLYGITDK